MSVLGPAKAPKVHARLTLVDLRPSIELLLQLQQPCGAIPWYQGGHTEPWCTVEGAMALLIGGECEAWERCYAWLSESQLEDGSFFAKLAGKNHWWRRETNFAAYVATGLWHHWLVEQDGDILQKYWPMVAKALDFVTAQQTPAGDILWAVTGRGQRMDDALVTGCSSIYKSLECGLELAKLLGKPQVSWQKARRELSVALRYRPYRFDRHWETKRRHSMDWFYPVLCGIYTPEEGIRQLRTRWFEFVDLEYGTRCVSDKGWYTVAETCELIMALLYCGQRKLAGRLFTTIQRHSGHRQVGVFETGYVVSENPRYWPVDPMSWTAAAVVLAADAVGTLTPASRLFTTAQPPPD